MIKIHVLQTGRVSVDIGVPLRQRNPLAKTGWFRGSKNRVWLPGLAVDKVDAKKSLEWIQELSLDKKCKEILATHDPAVKPHSIEV